MSNNETEEAVTPFPSPSPETESYRVPYTLVYLSKNGDSDRSTTVQSYRDVHIDAVPGNGRVTQERRVRFARQQAWIGIADSTQMGTASTISIGHPRPLASKATQVAAIMETAAARVAEVLNDN